MSATAKKMGFWQCWGMSVGVMIGSGIFLLPTCLLYTSPSPRDS